MICCCYHYDYNYDYNYDYYYDYNYDYYYDYYYCYYYLRLHLTYVRIVLNSLCALRFSFPCLFSPGAGITSMRHHTYFMPKVLVTGPGGLCISSGATSLVLNSFVPESGSHQPLLKTE